MTVVFPNPAGAETSVSVAVARPIDLAQLRRERGTSRPCGDRQWSFVSSSGAAGHRAVPAVRPWMKRPLEDAGTATSGGTIVIAMPANVSPSSVA